MKLSKAVSSILLAGLAIVGASPLASAVGGGPFGSASSPAITVADGVRVGEGYGAWQGKREDQGRGSRMQVLTYHRSPVGAVGGIRGVYVRSNWYFNGTDCYVSNFSIAKDNFGIGRNCDIGRFNQAGNTQTGTTQSRSYQAYDSWKNLDPTGSSGRGNIQMCINRAGSPDSCGGAILRGNNY